MSLFSSFFQRLAALGADGNPVQSIESGPVTDGFDIDAQKHDVNPLSQPARGIYIGVAGNVKLVTKKGTTLTYQNCQAGTWLPVVAIQVWNTGTTASGLIGGAD